jgi:NAD(P)-dependent dehydrogenase (short-subunit alcohol dehydrogenase family)
VQVDLANVGEVRELLKTLNAEVPWLHVLINNAGARFMEEGRSKEGVERTFATNHLGHFALTLGLKDRLVASGRGRVVNVASSAHSAGRGDFEGVLEAKEYDGRQAYAESKLANVVFTFELAKRWAKLPVTVNAVDPGGVASRFGLNNGIGAWVRHVGYYLKQRTLLSPKKAAETVVYLASAKEMAGVSGGYFRDKREVECSAVARDPAVGERLWEVSERSAKREAVSAEGCCDSVVGRKERGE